MQLRRGTAVMVTAYFLFLLPFTAVAHDINKILTKFPEFSTFNNLLSQTLLAGQINSRQTITVLAVDNAGLAPVVAKNPPTDVVRNMLSLHVLLDYFDEQKLRSLGNGSAVASTLFQSSGMAAGTAGLVNITDLKGGTVSFSPKDTPATTATFVKALEQLPYNISVIQISSPLPIPGTVPPPASPSPSPSPTPPRTLPGEWNFTAIMSSRGCKAFAEALLANAVAQNSFAGSVEGGLTIFCPSDDAMKNFAPEFGKLSAAGQASLLGYHGSPVYVAAASVQSINGTMTTLATDGDGRYGFAVKHQGNATLFDTGTSTAKIGNVVSDNKPLAIYTLDKVLMPKELFQATTAPAPSPIPPSPIPSPSPSPATPSPSPTPPTPIPSPSLPPSPSPSPPSQSPSPSPTSRGPSPSPVAQPPPADSNPPPAEAGGAGSPPPRNGAVTFNGRKLGAAILGAWVMVSFI